MNGVIKVPKEEPSNLRTESLRGWEGSLSQKEKLFRVKMPSEEDEKDRCIVRQGFFFTFGTINDKLVSAIAVQRNDGMALREEESGVGDGMACLELQFIGRRDSWKRTTRIVKRELGFWLFGKCC